MNIEFIECILTAPVIVIECFVLLYYTNSVMTYKHSRFESNLCIVIGYALYCCLCFIGQPILNVLGFIAVNFLVLYIGFAENILSIILKVIIITVFMMFTELVTSFLLGVEIVEDPNYLSIAQDLLFTLMSKTLYFILVVMLKYYTVSRNSGNKFYEMFWLLPLPIFTFGFFLMYNHVKAGLKYETNIAFMVMCFILIVSNFAAYLVCDRIIDKNIQIKRLREIESKNKTELVEYRILAEKYENTKIMRHDFRKLLAVLSDLISEDNEKAKKYMRELQFSQRDLDYARYTDNNILNVILAQKARECRDAGIEIHIHSDSPTLSFISDIDTVTIFSNLIDNAIEASADTEKKEIFVDLYTVNGAFSAVKVENNADREPVVSDGMPQTQKDDPDEHGLGIRSINNALKKYNSSLDWSYDKENKFFRTLVLLHIPPK